MAFIVIAERIGPAASPGTKSALKGSTRRAVPVPVFIAGCLLTLPLAGKWELRAGRAPGFGGVLPQAP